MLREGSFRENMIMHCRSLYTVRYDIGGKRPCTVEVSTLCENDTGGTGKDTSKGLSVQLNDTRLMVS